MRDFLFFSAVMLAGLMLRVALHEYLARSLYGRRDVISIAMEIWEWLLKRLKRK